MSGGNSVKWGFSATVGDCSCAISTEMYDDALIALSKMDLTNELRFTTMYWATPEMHHRDADPTLRMLVADLADRAIRILNVNGELDDTHQVEDLPRQHFVRPHVTLAGEAPGRNFLAACLAKYSDGLTEKHSRAFGIIKALLDHDSDQSRAVAMARECVRGGENPLEPELQAVIDSFKAHLPCVS